MQCSDGQGWQVTVTIVLPAGVGMIATAHEVRKKQVSKILL